MHLEGSCHCGAVKFSLQSDSPVPFMHCYCSICRKTAGGGSYAINLGGDASTMKVSGEKSIGIYHALMREKGKRSKRSPAKRHFCLKCGSALWLSDPRWPALIHPHVSAIDTPLPKPPELVEAALAYAVNWVLTGAALSGAANRSRVTVRVEPHGLTLQSAVQAFRLLRRDSPVLGTTRPVHHA
ncbi:MAG: GFA family protein [Burkholderiaceae bacterium]|nr:GFA family protein [Burkholderiaceae bacterium]